MILALPMLLGAALAVIVITIIIGIIFFIMYHTFHGDLPALMKVIVAIFMIIGFAMLALAIL